MGKPPPLCSTSPPRNHGRPASAAASRAVVLHHGVVVDVSDGAPLVRVQTHGREVSDDDGLEVHHQVPAERRVVHPGQQQQARRLDGATRHDDQLGIPGARDAVRPDELDAGGSPALRDDAADVGLGHQLGPPRRHGLGQQRHRVTLGVDGAAEERAVAAVVASRTAVVGDAVGRRRRLVGMQADLLGRGRRQQRPVHRCPGRHRIRTGAPGGERVGTLAPGDPDGPLHLGVIGLELVVVERPVVDGRSILGTIGGAEPEVLLPEARHLAVGVGAATADGGRDGVHLAHVRVLPLVRRAAERPRLDQRVGAEEVAGDELDLVVGVVARRLGHVVGIEEMVAALLHDDDGPPGPGEHLGRRGAAGAGADDDGVGRHGCDTSASL